MHRHPAHWLPPLLLLAAGPVSAAGIAPDCYCTDSTGGRVELGEIICLHVGGRDFLARCEMALNNPIWRDTGESCLSSGLPRSNAPARLPRPVTADLIAGQS